MSPAMQLEPTRSNQDCYNSSCCELFVSFSSFVMYHCIQLTHTHEHTHTQVIITLDALDS